MGDLIPRDATVTSSNSAGSGSRKSARRYGNRDGPPPESPIEHEMNSRLTALIREDADLFRQVAISTSAGSVRLDFVVSYNNKNIIIECDGKEFHQDKTRDLHRDACVLSTGKYDAVYRMRGTDISRHPFDCLYIIMLYDPDLFSERSQAIVRHQASEWVIEQARGPRTSHLVKYSPRMNEFGEEVSQLPLLVIRRTLQSSEIAGAIAVLKQKKVRERANAPKVVSEEYQVQRTANSQPMWMPGLSERDIAIGVIWSRVRAKRLCGLKFRRSRDSSGTFGVRCPSAKLFIKCVDGGSLIHDGPKMRLVNEADGYSTIYVSATDVKNYPDRFLHALEQIVQKAINR